MAKTIQCVHSAQGEACSTCDDGQPDPEIAALRGCVGNLMGLEPEIQIRIVEYLHDRYVARGKGS